MVNDTEFQEKLAEWLTLTRVHGRSRQHRTSRHDDQQSQNFDQHLFKFVDVDFVFVARITWKRGVGGLPMKQSLSSQCS